VKNRIALLLGRSSIGTRRLMAADHIEWSGRQPFRIPCIPIVVQANTTSCIRRAD